MAMKDQKEEEFRMLMEIIDKFLLIEYKSNSTEALNLLSQILSSFSNDENSIFWTEFILSKPTKENADRSTVDDFLSRLIQCMTMDQVEVFLLSLSCTKEILKLRLSQKCATEISIIGKFLPLLAERLLPALDKIRNEKLIQTIMSTIENLLPPLCPREECNFSLLKDEILLPMSKSASLENRIRCASLLKQSILLSHKSTLSLYSNQIESDEVAIIKAESTALNALQDWDDVMESILINSTNEDQVELQVAWKDLLSIGKIGIEKRVERFWNKEVIQNWIGEDATEENKENKKATLGTEKSEVEFLCTFYSHLSVHPIHPLSQSILQEKLNSIAQRLETTDANLWKNRFEGLRELELLLASKISSSPTLSQTFLSALPKMHLQNQIQDLRSIITKQACLFIQAMAYEYKAMFSPILEQWLPSLFQLCRSGVKVMASQGITCLYSVAAFVGESGLPKMISHFTDQMLVKKNHFHVKKACMMVITVAFRVWEPNVLEKHILELEKALIEGMEDRDPTVREEARKGVWAMFSIPQYQTVSETLIQSLDKSSQKRLNQCKEDSDKEWTESGRFRVLVETGKEGKAIKKKTIKSKSQPKKRIPIRERGRVKAVPCGVLDQNRDGISSRNNQGVVVNNDKILQSCKTPAKVKSRRSSLGNFQCSRTSSSGRAGRHSITTYDEKRNSTKTQSVAPRSARKSIHMVSEASLVPLNLDFFLKSIDSDRFQMREDTLNLLIASLKKSGPSIEIQSFIHGHTNIFRFSQALSSLMLDHTMRVCKAALSATKMVFLNKELSTALMRHLPDLFLPILIKLGEKNTSNLAEQCWNASCTHIPKFEVIGTVLFLLQCRLESPRNLLTEATIVSSLDKVLDSVCASFSHEMGITLFKLSGGMLYALFKLPKMMSKAKSAYFNIELLQRHILKLIMKVKRIVLSQISYCSLLAELPREERNSIVQTALGFEDECSEELNEYLDGNVTGTLTFPSNSDDPIHEYVDSVTSKKKKVGFNPSNDLAGKIKETRDIICERKMEANDGREGPCETPQSAFEDPSKVKDFKNEQIQAPNADPIVKFISRSDTHALGNGSEKKGKLTLAEIIDLFKGISSCTSSQHEMNLRLKALVQCAKENRSSDCWDDKFNQILNCLLDGLSSNDPVTSQNSSSIESEIRMTPSLSSTSMSDLSSTIAYANKKHLYLQGIRSLLRYQSHHFSDHIEKIIEHLLECSNDSSFEIAHTAEKALEYIVTSQDSLRCLRYIIPHLRQINEKDASRKSNAIILMSLRILCKAIPNVPSKPLLDSLPSMLPHIFKALSHVSVDMRKASVFCIVEINVVLSWEDMNPYLGGLTVAQRKLINIYIDRHKSKSVA